MNSLEDDQILGRFFDTAEKKAKWIYRIKLLYIIWIFFVIVGILSILLWFLIN